jgi:hypothetical protein
MLYLKQFIKWEQPEQNNFVKNKISLQKRQLDLTDLKTIPIIALRRNTITTSSWPIEKHNWEDPKSQQARQSKHRAHCLRRANVKSGNEHSTEEVEISAYMHIK